MRWSVGRPSVAARLARRSANAAATSRLCFASLGMRNMTAHALQKWGADYGTPLRTAPCSHQLEMHTSLQRRAAQRRATRPKAQPRRGGSALDKARAIPRRWRQELWSRGCVTAVQRGLASGTALTDG